MSRKALSVILFVCGFIVTYALLTFMLAGNMKWALGTTHGQMIVGNICYMPVFKSIVSLIVGVLAAVLPKRKR